MVSCRLVLNADLPNTKPQVGQDTTEDPTPLRRLSFAPCHTQPVVP
jgi:hypothetical protein